MLIFFIHQQLSIVGCLDCHEDIRSKQHLPYHLIVSLCLINSDKTTNSVEHHLVPQNRS